jgi:hypothetical protein
MTDSTEKDDADKVLREHPLATKRGLELMLGLLLHTGAMCPKCGFGTRVTSKRWAKCKKCGERVERRELPK